MEEYQEMEKWQEMEGHQEMEESQEKYAANLAVTNGQKEKSGRKSGEKFDGVSGGSLGEKWCCFCYL